MVPASNFVTERPNADATAAKRPRLGVWRSCSMSFRYETDKPDSDASTARVHAWAWRNALTRCPKVVDDTTEDYEASPTQEGAP